MTLLLAPTDQKRGDRPVYRLLAAIVLQGVAIPAGFLTDLVSAPAWMRKHLPLVRMKPGALLHDWLMNCTDVSRWKANRLFRRQMQADGVSFFWRWLVWLYVSRPFAVRNRWAQPYLEGSEA